MSREKNLIKNTAIISIGTFFPKFLTVLITPILTSQLTKAEYGQYDLITTIVSLLLPVVTLQISSAAFRFLIIKRNHKSDSEIIISTIYLFVVATTFLAGLIYFCVIGNKLGTIGSLVAIYFVFDMLLLTTQQMLRGLGKNLMYSIGTVIQSTVLLLFISIFTGIFGNQNKGLNGVVVSLTLSVAIPFFILIYRSGIIGYVKLNKVSKQLLKEMLNYSWPMVPNNLSVWVLNLSDRLVITAVLGVEANAIYAVANKMPTIFSSFQNTFSMAWQENASLAADDIDKDIYYSKMCDWVYSLLTGLMAMLIMCTPVIWKILVHGDYEEAYYQLPILYLGVMFNCMSATIGGIYIAHMKTKSVGITTMVAAVINFTIDICFVGSIGIWAGSISTMISYFFLWLYRLIDVQKFQKINIDKRNIILSIILLSIMGIFNYQNNPLFNYMNILMCGIVLFIFDRKILSSIYMKIKSRLNRDIPNQ